MRERPAGPKFLQYFGPVLTALRTLGGSARPSEVVDQVAKDLRISDAERAEMLESGSVPRFDNQVAWARFYLAKAGLIDSSKRGVWSLTDRGRSLKQLSHADALKLFKGQHASLSTGAGATTTKDQEKEVEQGPPEGQQLAAANHRQEVLELLQSLPPDGFERFCQRLLRESGFQEVTVTGRSGDGGIDGLGLLQVNPLVSFKVLFQCKRYRGSVSPSQVRDFRGAMMGRADKGIIITTGTFTADAKKEAIRDGVPPIELVDGKKVVDMIENLELGLKPVQSYVIDLDFFEDFGLKKEE